MSSSAAEPFCQYHITHTPWRHNYDVKTPDGQQLYHAFNAQWAIGKPALKLYAGSDDNGLVVGAVTNLQFSSKCEVCLGDPSQEDIAWQVMRNTGVTSIQYVSQIDLGDGTVVRFTWKEKQSKGISGIVRGETYEMVNNETEEVLAVFSAGSSFTMKKKTAHFDIYANYGKDFNLMALLTILAVREKQRRRTQNMGGRAAMDGGGMGGMAGGWAAERPGTP